MDSRIDSRILPHARWVAGFSLVEILVGMAVGVIAVIVIMQSFATFEGQKRTTTSGSDTQENGLIALQAIEADARTAGYGLVSPKGLACTTMNYYERGIVAAGSFATVNVAPVTVVDGGAAGSDTLLFTAATSPMAGMPIVLDVNIMTPAQITFLPAQILTNDLYLLAEPLESPGIGRSATPCSRLANAVGAGSPTNRFNTTNIAAFFPVGGYSEHSGFFIDLGNGASGGAGFMRSQYAVANNDLVFTDVSHMNAGNSVVLASNIVNMQVQYGVAPVNTSKGASSPAVDCWTDATGTLCNSEQTWDAPSAADIMRIKAIRIAVVARSSLQEKPSTPGGSCDATPIGGVQSWPGGPAIDLSADANWQCYRYRVYQTIIPLRNVIWANI